MNELDAAHEPSHPEGSRFRVEERSGIVAVYDTAHPEYQDTPGCHADYPWVVCSWRGRYVKPPSPECINGVGHWVLEGWQLEKARNVCGLLNANVLEITEENQEIHNPITNAVGDVVALPDTST